MALQFFDKVT